MSDPLAQYAELQLPPAEPTPRKRWEYLERFTYFYWLLQRCGPYDTWLCPHDPDVPGSPRKAKYDVFRAKWAAMSGRTGEACGWQVRNAVAALNRKSLGDGHYAQECLRAATAAGFIVILD